MKAKNYDQLLKARGFKCTFHTKYQGVNVYEKEHKFNRSVCYVKKDTHGKGQEMTFDIYRTSASVQNIDEFKEKEFDRSYLVKEAIAIHEAFENLKNLKAPKHLYCF